MSKPWEPRPCNKHCGTMITLEKRGSKADGSDLWLPIEANGEVHNCSEKNAPKQESKPKMDVPKKNEMLEGYYANIIKLAELSLADANSQLAGGGWELLRIIDKRTSKSHPDAPNTEIVLTTTEIVYILGKKA